MKDNISLIDVYFLEYRKVTIQYEENICVIGSLFYKNIPLDRSAASRYSDKISISA